MKRLKPKPKFGLGFFIVISEIPHIWRDFGNRDIKRNDIWISDFQVNIRKSDILKIMAEEKPIFYKTLGLAWEMGYVIAGPLVVLAFLGRFLDKKYGASPVFLLSGVFLAMIISGVIVFKKTKKIMEDVK